MKRFIPTLGTFLLIFTLPTERSAASDVGVGLSEKPPTENLLYSFQGKVAPDGWGWTGISDEWRDTGMSFRAPAEGQIGKITLYIEKISYGNFLKKSGFTLRIFETKTIEQPPETGKLLYSGKGEIALSDKDRNKYLTLALGEGIGATAGAFYTFLLSWGGEAPYNVIVFHCKAGYRDGRAWFREAGSWAGRRPSAARGEWEYLDQPDQPGLILYVQNSPSKS